MTTLSHVLALATTILLSAPDPAAVVLEWDGISPAPLSLDEIGQRCETGLRTPGRSADSKFELALRLAHVRYYQRKHAAALDAVRVALKLRPDRPDALSRLGQILIREGSDEQQVADIAKRLIVAAPMLPDGPFLMARYLQERGQHGPAIAHFDKAIELSPHFIPALFGRAYAAYDLRRYEQCIVDLKQMLSLPPIIDDAFPKARHLLAHCLFHVEDYQGSAALLANLHRENPDNLQISSLLWTCYGKTRQSHSGLAVADEQLKAHPDNERSRWMRARSLAQLGNLTEAEHDARAAIALDPRSQAARTTLGVVVYRQGKLQESLDAYQLALQMGPPYFDAIFHAAFVFCTSPDGGQRRPEIARDMLVQCLPFVKSESHRCQGLLILGIAYAELGDAKESNRSLQEAIKLAGSVPYLRACSQRVATVLQRDGRFRLNPRDTEAPSFLLDAADLIANPD
jgi:tetratricopeptide (TPR) repeat protein